MIIKDNSFPDIPPFSFTIELPDELFDKFNINFLRDHFLSHVSSAYTDIYIVESEEAITEINARVWERKRTLLDIFLEGEEKNRL